MVSDEDQIRELVHRWMTATRTRDTRAVLELMTEDALFLVAGREPMTKADFTAQADQQTAPGQPSIMAVSDIQEIRVLGEWAYLWSKLRVTIKPVGDADEIIRAGPTLTLLRKVDGHWLLARDANMLVVTHNPGPLKGAGQ